MLLTDCSKHQLSMMPEGLHEQAVTSTCSSAYRQCHLVKPDVVQVAEQVMNSVLKRARRSHNISRESIEDRMPESKTCTNCKRTLPAQKFKHSFTSRDGLQHWCKDCKEEEDFIECGSAVLPQFMSRLSLSSPRADSHSPLPPHL